MILPINQTDQPGAKRGRGRREKNSDRKQVGKMMFVFYKQNREHKSTVTEKADSGSLCVRLYEIGNLALLTFQPFFFAVVVLTAVFGIQSDQTSLFACVIKDLESMCEFGRCGFDYVHMNWCV